MRLLFCIFALLLLGAGGAGAQPVTVTIEIPAEVAAHLEALRTSGNYAKLVETPGGGGLPIGGAIAEPMYGTLEEFIRGEIRRVWLGPLLERFPTAAIEQRLAAIKTERDAIDALKQEAVREPEKIR